MFTKGHKINKGRKHSDMAKENFRLSKIGDKNPMFGRIGSRKGQIVTQETKEKMRIAKLGVKRPQFSGENHPRYGKHLSYEERLKKSVDSRGDKGNNWQGGITQLNKSIRNLFEYRQWVSDIFERDEYTCLSCGRRGGILNAHHKKAFCVILKENQITTVQEALSCRELWNINNGVTLCRECHKKTDNFAGRVNN